MKKTIWIVLGIVLLVGLLVIKERSKVETLKVEGRAEADGSSVSQASSLPLEEQGLQDADGTGGAARPRDAVAPAKAYAEENLSEPVKVLLGLDGQERNYPRLIAEVHKLGDNLSDADVAALRELLIWPNDRFPEKMRPIEINAVKNDVLDKLLRQNELSEGLGIQIAEMAGNPDNDSVWRDYCVQFMQPFYERCSAESMGQGAGSVSQASSLPLEEGQGRQNAGGTEEELAVVRNAMFSALDERSETIAGTALIGLELLSRIHEEFDREQIVEKAVEVASDWNASPSCRLTALRMSSDLATKNAKNTKNSDGEPETRNSGLETDVVADMARTLAQTGETVLLRSAAIVTLGETGPEEDRELLESFTLAENKQIAAAAQMALEKMNERN